VDSDELLLARSATDPASFEPLVERHSPALYAYLARRMPNAAEDVLSEVWLSAYAGRATFDPDRGPARGWLFGIARNAVVTHLRRSIALPLGYGGAEERGWDAVDDRIDAQRSAPAVFAAVRALPDGERELLLLVALDGLTPTEAGAALGIPAGTARSRLHRARARIREQLDAAEPEPPHVAPTPLTSHLIPGAIA
jgi:RNA polymerase sigma-70 factor (ECF subfamily)